MIPLTERTPSVIELDPAISPPTALPDRIYATLKHRILTCAMRPGERIVEKELCKEMQVSRTPLREAFNRLSLEGLIVLSPYRGYAVAPVTDMSVHYDVPVPHIVRGRIPVLAETPRFAFLDDRHGVRICGEDAIYSKGDMMGFIGSVFLGIPGLILLIIGWIWRKIFRRTRGPVP